jgi:hypothetical protein
MTIANQIISFKLSGINYTGTSTQLNYTSGVTQGAALANKALVIDTNKSITGITLLAATELSAANLSGTLQTAAQPNITSVGTLTNLVVAGNANVTTLSLNGNLVTSTANELNLLAGLTNGTASASKALVVSSARNITNINSLSSTEIITTTMTYKGSVVSSSGTQLSYTDVTPGTASASKSLVLDSNKGITGITSLGSTSISASTVTGTLQTPAQPNVTSVGTLTSLTVTGTTQLGTVTATSLGLTSITASTLTGTLQTAAQPNVTSVGTLSSLSVSGSVQISGSLNTSQLQINSQQVDSTASEINRLSGVSVGNATASKTLVFDSNKSITGITSLGATSVIASTLSGTLQTAAQPNVTSVGTLTSLTATGQLSTSFSNVTTTPSSYISCGNTGAGITTKLEGDNSSFRFGTTTDHPFRLMANSSSGLTLESNGNVSVGTVSASAYRLNVAGSLNSSQLFINGQQVDASSAELNRLSGISAGSASASKALVLDSNKSITGITSLGSTSIVASTLSGTLQTASQPNVTSVGTLTNLTTISAVIQNPTATADANLRLTNNLRSLDIGLAGNGSSANANLFYIADGTTRLVMDTTGNITIGGNSNSSSYKLNVIGSVNAGQLFINGQQLDSTSSELNRLSGITLGTASASKAVLLDSNKSISGITSLSASSISGTLQTAAQPNVTSVGTLTSLALSGAITGATNVSLSGTLTCDTVTSNSLGGTLLTGTQPNITSTGILSGLISSSAVKIGTPNSAAADLLHVESNNVNGVGIQIENRNTTSNASTYIKFSGYNSSNDNYDLASITCGYVAANANFGYGYLSFSTRNNSNSAAATERMRITQDGNVGIGKTNPTYMLDVDGTINASEIRILGQLVSASTSDLNRLSGVTAGTASASKAVVLDSNKSITGITDLSASTLAGTLQTAVQPNVTSVGTLTSLTVNGATQITGATSVVGNLNMNANNITNIGDISALSIGGTLSTSSQPMITGLGTLGSLSVTNFSKFGITSNTALDIVHIEGSSSSTIGLQLDNTNTTANSGTHIKFNGYHASNANYDLARITCGYVAANASYGYGYLSFATRNNAGNSSATERMRITQDGSVGIGITNPIYALDVSGVVKASTSLLVGSNDTSRECSILNAAVSIGSAVRMSLGQSNSSYNQGEIAFAYLSPGSTSNYLALGLSSSTFRVVVDGNAYLGVGISSPQNNVHINQRSTSTCLTLDYSGSNSTKVRLGCTTNSKLFCEGGMLIGGTNTVPSNGGFVYINGSDSISITNYGYITGDAVTGTNGPSGSFSCSLRTTGRIVASGEIDILSDVRSKENITDISLEYCQRFVNSIKPKFYKYKNQSSISTGFIAQDIVKAGFKEVIGFAKEDIPELVDEDGFLSPAGQAFTVNYDGIVPILTKCIDDLYKQIKELKKEIASLKITN